MSRRYRYFGNLLSQPDAAADCTSKGGKLADLRTNCRLDEIREAIVGTKVEKLPVTTEMWIGGKTDSPHHERIQDQDNDRGSARCRILSNWRTNTGHLYNVYAKNCEEKKRYLCEFSAKLL